MDTFSIFLNVKVCCVDIFSILCNVKVCCVDIFSIFFNVKVCCVFSLESPHHTFFNIKNEKRKSHLNYPKSAAMGFFFQETKNEFETAVVNEPSVFEPLTVYCN